MRAACLGVAFGPWGSVLKFPPKAPLLGKINEYTRSWDGKKGAEVVTKSNIYYWDQNDLKALYKPRPAEIESFL